MSGFRLSTVPFDTTALRAGLGNPAAGGYASFEGWVRNHNEGRAVTSLEYEAFEPLALKEGECILSEAKARFPILEAACVHRVGSLGIGELAVWVGVSARHRDAAFAACRYIIDETKHRVPIWKKEHYADGDSGWVNCERCAAPSPGEHKHLHVHDHSQAHEHSQSQPRSIAPVQSNLSAPFQPQASLQSPVHGQALTPDYSRQMALKEIGPQGQAKLRASRVLVIGAGGLGVPVLSYLAGAGVGTLDIIDGDNLEASNLHRQPLYVLADIGKPKAELAAARIRALNPEITVHAYVERFDSENAFQLLENCDLAIDCSDNFATKFLLNDTCVLANKPAVFASVYQYEGQLQVYKPAGNSACLRCLWPEATRDGIVGNCAAAGVLGPVPGVLGTLQALEAIKQLLDLPGQLGNELLVFDLTTLESRKIRTSCHADCRGGRCTRIGTLASKTSTATLVSTAPETSMDLELNFSSLALAVSEGYHIVDIREDYEVAQDPIAGVAATHIPMGDLLSEPAVLDSKQRHLLVCAHGVRSFAVAAELRSQGLPEVYSLRGGLAAQ